MSNLHSIYTKIFERLHEIDPNHYYLNQTRLPRLTDKQLIALNLAAGGLGVDSERYLFNRLPDEFRGKVERCVYNRRRRNYAKSFQGFAAQIVSKITTLTMIQWINKRNGNNLKIVFA